MINLIKDSTLRNNHFWTGVRQQLWAMPQSIGSKKKFPGHSKVQRRKKITTNLRV